MQGNAEGQDESGEQCKNLLQLCQQRMMMFPGQQRLFVNAVLFFERLASFGSMIIKRRWLRAPLCHRLTALAGTQVVNNLSCKQKWPLQVTAAREARKKWIFDSIWERKKKKKKGRVCRSGPSAPKQVLNYNIPSRS